LGTGTQAAALYINDREQIAGLSYTNSTPNVTTGFPTIAPPPFLWCFSVTLWMTHRKPLPRVNKFRRPVFETPVVWYLKPGKTQISDQEKRFEYELLVFENVVFR